MDKELDTYIEKAISEQQYKNGIFSKFWQIPNLFDAIRRRKLKV
jgi:hypothetical protein